MAGNVLDSRLICRRDVGEVFDRPGAIVYVHQAIGSVAPQNYIGGDANQNLRAV